MHNIDLFIIVHSLTLFSAGGTQRLPRLIGATKAKELIFTGAVLDSEKSYKYGLVNEAVTGPALPAALALAEKFLNKGKLVNITGMYHCPTKLLRFRVLTSRSYCTAHGEIGNRKRISDGP